MAHALSPEQFELIDEPLTAESGGCGFIPEELLIELLRCGKERIPIAAKRATSIQVRIIIVVKDTPGAPGGIFKGMLTAKAGISKIQLPPSMHKAPPLTSRAVRVHSFLGRPAICRVRSLWFKLLCDRLCRRD